MARTRKTDDPLIGRSLNNYKITQLLGKGGMSYVYKATDQNLDRDVAIKVITGDRDRAKEMMKRFRREARTISKLDKHPNIVRIYYFGADEETATQYFAMELIRGETLTQRLARLKKAEQYMEYDEIIRIMHQIADALDYAHQNGVIHRDIKPSNIMIEKGSERAVLMDFGLVRETGNESTLGTAFGTPRYIAPEQAVASQQAVPQSDIYALGVILFELLTGRVPFDDESAMSLALSHITNPPPAPQEIRADLPSAAAKVVLKALEKSPEDRYATATQMIEALATALGVTGVPAPSHNLSATRSDKLGSIGSADISTKDKTSAMPASSGKDGSSTIHQLKKASRKIPVIPLAIVGVVIVAVIVGVVVLGGGGEANGTAKAALRLVYTDDSLVIYNASDRALDLNGITLITPDERNFFMARDLGAQTLSNFVPGRCIQIFINGQRPEVPDYCKEDETTQTRPIGVNTKTSARFFWVWNSASGNQEFQVILMDTNEPTTIGGQEYRFLKTCQISAGSCEIQWTQFSQVTDT